MFVPKSKTKVELIDFIDKCYVLEEQLAQNELWWKGRKYSFKMLLEWQDIAWTVRHSRLSAQFVLSQMQMMATYNQVNPFNPCCNEFGMEEYE